MKHRIKHWITRIFLPHFWMQNHRTSIKYSKKLEEQLNDPDSDIVVLDEYCVMINNVGVWIENYPYAYGYLYGSIDWSKKLLPAAHVRRKLKKIVKEKSKPTEDFIDNIWND